MPNRLLITNVSIAKMDEPDDGYGLMTHAALLIQGDKIEWLGSVSDIPAGLGDTEHHPSHHRGRLRAPCRVSAPSLFTAVPPALGSPLPTWPERDG